MLISMIVAASENNVIAKDNELPWHLPNDLAYFEQTTRNCALIMGRLSYSALPTLLHTNRTNIVLSKNANAFPDNIPVFSNLDNALNFAKSQNFQEVFLAGGQKLYELGMSIAQKIYLTRVHHTFLGDVFFPEIAPHEWRLTRETKKEADDENAFAHSFLVYERVK
jgi:dihydrofolate reductase